MRARPSPRLIVISDAERVTADRVVARCELLARAAAPGTVSLQLRDPRLGARALLRLGLRLRDVAREHDQWLAVSDRVDLALLLEADAVHLGERSVDARDARALLGDCFITRACHDPAAVAAIDADAIVLSPVVERRKGNPPLGLETFGAACAAAQAAAPARLVYALGGVTASSARACLEAGAAGVAVIGAALDARDPLALLAALDIERR